MIQNQINSLKHCSRSLTQCLAGLQQSLHGFTTLPCTWLHAWQALTPKTLRQAEASAQCPPAILVLRDAGAVPAGRRVRLGLVQALSHTLLITVIILSEHKVHSHGRGRGDHLASGVGLGPVLVLGPTCLSLQQRPPVGNTRCERTMLRIRASGNTLKPTLCHRSTARRRRTCNALPPGARSG